MNEFKFLNQLVNRVKLIAIEATVLKSKFNFILKYNFIEKLYLMLDIVSKLDFT